MILGLPANTSTAMLYALKRFRSLAASSKLLCSILLLQRLAPVGDQYFTLDYAAEFRKYKERLSMELFLPVERYIENEEKWRIVSAVQGGRYHDVYKERLSPQDRWCEKQDRLPKRHFYDRPSGARRKGRPRLRWLDDLQDDLALMGVRRWRMKAKERDFCQKLLD